MSDLGKPADAARVVAFNLPQFHPIPENNEWWGPGFTEWTNVVRARPLFRGHQQPHLPADLGFYDLRLPEARLAQALLARRNGISAFCYWHYWFAGRRLLERPVSEIVASGNPDFPFFLGWANQTWTGVWHGAPHRVLIEQTYPDGDDRAHFDHLMPVFTDKRYLTVDGKPVFYVFRPEDLPNPRAWTDAWREMAAAQGLPGLYLIAEVSDLHGVGPKYVGVESDGWDAGVYVRLPMHRTKSTVLQMRARRKLRGGPETYPYARTRYTTPESVRDWVLPCVYPNWDNTPRSGRGGLVLTGSSPEHFGRELQAAINELDPRRGDERLLFVKSWNEWAEGNYLEPDLEFGHGWLEKLGSVVGRVTD